MHWTENSQPSRKSDVHLSQLASVGQIAAGIAHEVKNPLTAVKGFLQLLKERNEQKYIEIAQSELENAIAVLQNLLQMSKPDLEEPFVSLDLTVELESLTQLFQDQFYRVTVVKHFQHPGTFIVCKKNQIKKALFNLLKNAFEAIPDKGTITIGQSASESEVTIYIQDNGSGIPKKKLELLGTPFFTTKENGTGMGLTFVFSVIHQNNGTIKVESEESVGTKFTISFPLTKDDSVRREAAVLLQLERTENGSLKEFFEHYRSAFEERLLAEAVNVREKIDEIMAIGNIDLVANAHKLVLYIVEGREHEVVSFARTEGISWAKHSLTLAFKLEWIQAVRRVMWNFLYNYDLMNDYLGSKEQFYDLEKRINELMDLFLSHFFMSYSQFKDNLIRAQQEIVEDLSVPIIPVTPSTAILPLIGDVDLHRSAAIEDKVISHLGDRRIESLIIDLSGVLKMEAEVIVRLIRMIDGIKMMGCQTTITGLRPETVKIMISSDLTFTHKAMTKGTLQQALAEHLLQDKDAKGA
ncbi:ATP-binding protein [Cohnella massiliensis]|uniref:ATP-binding protein n=1 Tax=Cohnella massiliensis TaxID=1816691 RepID=UPI0009BC238C|nr:ATP-binding protein [Cohnella massiliensis]